MSARASQGQPTILSTRWPDEFRKTRRFTEYNTTYVDVKRDLDADAESIVDLLLSDSDETIPNRGVEAVRAFCHGVNLHDLATGRNGAGQRRVAWLDDRSSCDDDIRPSRNLRQCNHILTATELHRELLKPLNGYEGEPDVERRLIYISNIDPFYILALTETAQPNQINPLRDALRNHIPRQSCLKVKIQSSGYKTFQMEMHLPYFVLRKRTAAEAVRQTSPNHLGRWGDLGFLNIPTRNSKKPATHGIHPAQFSLVLSGRDDRNWTGYCFDTGPDNDTLAEEKVCDNDIHIDPIASFEDPVEANAPIRDPRSYFLRVLEARIAHILKEWELVVEEIANGMSYYGINDHVSMPIRFGAGTERADLIKRSDNWTRQTTQLLSDLLETLSATVKACNRFQQRDYEYFYDIKDAPDRAVLSLHGAETAIEDLKDCEEKLVCFKDRCRDYRRDLEICILREYNEAAARNGLTTDFTVMILYPVALAAAIFSMQGNVLWFPLNTRSFIISVFVLIAFVIAFRFMIHHLITYLPRWRVKAGTCRETPRLMSLYESLARVLSRSSTFLPSWRGGDAELNRSGQLQGDAISLADV